MGELGRGVIFWGLFTTMVHAIWFLTSFSLPPFSAKNFIHSQYIPIINGVELIFFPCLKVHISPPPTWISIAALSSFLKLMSWICLFTFKRLLGKLELVSWVLDRSFVQLGLKFNMAIQIFSSVICFLSSTFLNKFWGNQVWYDCYINAGLSSSRFKIVLVSFVIWLRCDLQLW